MTKENRKFSVSDYNKSRDDYTQSWKAIDETFYRLCRDHPQHNERPWVNAKILIIGRTYATGIRTEGTDDWRPRKLNISGRNLLLYAT